MSSFGLDVTLDALEPGSALDSGCYGAGVSARASSAPGARGSLYVPVAPLARGGMGSVELVLRREGEFRRLYARKRPHPHPERETSFRGHFLREARVAGLLRHPNVVSVLDVGEDPDGPYLVMDFVDGISLASLIGRFRAEGELLPLQVCLTIARHAADGLHAAHELRDHDGSAVALVHRDVSPQNILIDYEGIARVTDFGLAKALAGEGGESSSDALKGKVGYMSPEQLRFEPLDRRSDLWALGVVLYEMLACERLYPGGSGGIERVARQILDDPPPDVGAVRDDAPPALTELVFDLLAKDRADRPSTASEVSRRLGEILREVEATDGVIELADFVDEHFAEERARARASRAAAIARAEAEPEPAPSSRGRLALASVAAAALAAAIGAGVWSWLDRSDPPPARPDPVEPVAVEAPIVEAPELAPSPGAPAPGEGAAVEPAPEAEPRSGADDGSEAPGDEADATADEGQPEADRPPSTRRPRGRRREPTDRLWEWP